VSVRRVPLIVVVILLAGVAATATPAAAQENALQCRPFGAGDDPQGKLDGLRSDVLPLMTGLPAAHHLFDEYLTPGAASADRETMTDATARSEFRRSPATVAALRALLDQLKAKVAAAPPRLTRPGKPVGGTLAGQGLGAALVIDYPLGYTTPGLIAGGTGSVDSAAGTFTDARAISGAYRLRPVATRRGVLKRVVLTIPHARLRVDDSIDFCPGGLGGRAGEALGTLTMSRLERTPYSGAGTYARPILWRLETPLDAVSASVTGSYPRNDRDHDGRPDRQPWKGAHFALDPCPRTRRCAMASAAGAVRVGVGIRLRAEL
jgi:hypothetical protein